MNIDQLLENHQVEEALSEFSKFEDIGTIEEIVIAKIKFAKYFLIHGTLEKTLQLTQEIIRLCDNQIDPNHCVVLVVRGYAFFQNLRFEEAEKCFLKASMIALQLNDEYLLMETDLRLGDCLTHPKNENVNIIDGVRHLKSILLQEKNSKNSNHIQQAEILLKRTVTHHLSK